jgi:pimeloyl-ACP methyl ester carboxylesterase
VSTFVLVHGSWHGGWCWERVVPPLAAAGHTVLAPDLIGLGADRTPPAAVSLATWTDQIGALLAASEAPVVLVGHSRGGIAISQVAEVWPERVAALVYICAFLARDGEALIQLAQMDEESRILPHLTIDEAAGAHTVAAAAARDLFYHDCPEAEAARAIARLRPEPNAPTFTPVHVTDARFGGVPRFYIECQQDRVISLGRQRQMQAGLPCRGVVTMDTGHSPWLAAPDDLVAHLTALTAPVAR